jgi:5'-3' exonuclease
MNKVIVLDEGNIKHKAIFAFRSNPQIPAAYTFMRMIIGYLKRFDIDLDDKIILAMDYGRSWRKDLDKEYKAQRKAFREHQESKEWWDEVYKEMNQLYERIEPFINWHFVKKWTIESDDWASVAARIFTDKEIILVSSDKDWEMLCHFENVKVFSTITKKFKEVKYPMNVLASKIKSDISDNLLHAPTSEAEFEKRKLIVNLLELPADIENPLKEVLLNLPLKNLYIKKLPFYSVQKELDKLYFSKEK